LWFGLNDRAAIAGGISGISIGIWQASKAWTFNSWA
jgi:hypothetical protein